jgi:type IV secretion system protein VirB4
MFGSGGLFGRGAAGYLPYLGHAPDANTVLLADGSLLACGELHGVAQELASPEERAAQGRFLNSLWRQISDPDVTLNVHLVRFRKSDQLPVPAFRNDFARRFDAAYRERVLDELYANRWYLSLAIAPRLAGGQKEFAREFARLRARFRKSPVPDDPYRVAALEDLWLTISRSLEGYHLRRLGLREHGGMLFSEIAEALRLILYCKPLPIGLTDGPIGSAIYTDRVVFERRHYRLLHPEGVRYGAIFGLREYMAATRPGILDALLPLRMPLVLSQSFGFLPRQEAIQRLARKQNQMVAANDRAFAQIADIDNALSEVAGGEVARGMHHLSLAIYSDSFAELEQNAGLARSELASAGAVVAQESIGNEAAYFAQLPGAGSDWRTRPGIISTRNFAHLADFGAFPQGSRQGRWGNAVIRFKTVGHTAYDYVPHVDDVGMTVVFGRTGSGKTTWLGVILAMADAAIDDNGIIFTFDKDRGQELLVRAVGGTYLEIRAGEASGLAPLRGLQNTPADRDFLVRWLKALIQLDGHGPLPVQDDGRLDRAVRGIMRLPVQLRSLEALRQFLGWREPMGAGPRLERWARPGAFGWAFDGGNDEVDLDARIVGFDLTSILGNPEVVNPAAQYLLYRIGSVIDGRRAVIALDECRAYILHPQFRDTTEDFLLRGRKNNAAVFLCTQEPEHFLDGSTFAQTVIDQCFTKIFFRHPTASEQVHREVLHLTEGEFRAIREDMLPGSRQCLIKRDGGSVIVDFDLSAMPEFIAVLSGRATSVRFAERIRQEKSSDWVSEFMSRHKEVVD